MTPSLFFKEVKVSSNKFITTSPWNSTYIKAYLHFVCTLHKQHRVTGMINCVFLNDLHLHTYYQISCPFLQTIVLSVFLRYTDSDYPFGIIKLFLTYLLDLL
jgi:hypothetical protein